MSVGISRGQSPNGISVDYPEIDMIIHDSSSVSQSLLSIDVFDYIQANRSHLLVLGQFGQPKVHIWTDGHPNVTVFDRPRVAQWWDSQQTWTALYVDPGTTPVTYLHSPDLEQFSDYETGYTLDGHAIELTHDNQTINLIATIETVFDQNDLIPGDSIEVRWTEWMIDDQMGGYEYIPLIPEYNGLDIHSIGLPQGQQGNSERLDPLHGNSVDYATTSNSYFIGTTNRTIDEVLIMRDTNGQRTFFHFGGPLNQFAYSNDSVLAIKAHDLRFSSVSDTSAVITFFSNGDGESAGGEYGAGKEVELNFNAMTAVLADQKLLPFSYSNAMGSYSPETKTIAPGVWVNGPDIESVLMLEFDSLGNEVMRVEHNYLNPKFSYQANRYPIEVDSTLLRPILIVECDEANDQIVVSAEKEGIKDSYQFFVDGNAWAGATLNDSTIILPYDFEGSLNVMSRFWNEQFEFTIDKYSDDLMISENHCSTIVTVTEVETLKFVVENGILSVADANFITIFDQSGKVVRSEVGRSLYVKDLPVGIYILETDLGRSKFQVP